jgi:hypothetical protein
MSLSLPTSFTVFTDQRMLVDEMLRLGHSAQAEMIASFNDAPYSFVLFGTEPQHETGWATTVLVFKAPSQGLSLTEFADAFAESFDRGPKEVTRESRRSIGVGPYPAVQLDLEVEQPGFGLSLGRYFVIQNRSEMWFVAYDFPAEEAVEMRPIWNRSIDSLVVHDTGT